MSSICNLLPIHSDYYPVHPYPHSPFEAHAQLQDPNCVSLCQSYPLIVNRIHLDCDLPIHILTVLTFDLLFTADARSN